jgi:carbon monoxide dehydrogenase subunit G
MQFTRSIQIDADAERVWALSTDVEAWPALMSTVTSVDRIDDGPFRVGSQARIKQPRQRARIWTVRELVAPNRFVWDAKIGPATVTARHLVEPAVTGTTNTLQIELTGPLSGLIGRLTKRAMLTVLDTENRAFKHAAETPA